MSKEGNTGAKIHCAVCGRTFDAAADKCPNCSAPASLSQPVSEPREEKREPVFVCTICGHVHEGKAAPDRCENCGVGGELIEERRPALTRTWVCTVCGLKIRAKMRPRSVRSASRPPSCSRLRRTASRVCAARYAALKSRATQRPTAAKTAALTGTCSSP